jgi:hypothetical protein
MSVCRAALVGLGVLAHCGCGGAEPAGGRGGAAGAPSTPATSDAGPGASGAAAADAAPPPEPAPPDAGGAASPAALPCLDFAEPVVVGSIELAELDQLSGLVASRAQPGVLFAHEDSTGAPLVYGLDVSGRALLALTLEGAPSSDWEDIAVGPGPDGSSQLFIGDIGDNAVRSGGAPRSEIQVLRFPEPELRSGDAFVTRTLADVDVLRFTYPEGVHESETLMVHPRTGDILIITRSTTGDSRVYRAPASTPVDTPTPLEEIARLAFAPSGQGALATAGDISPNGDRILVRTYTDVYVWPAAEGTPLEAVFRLAPRVTPWALEPQGEGLSFTADGRAWLAAGEQSPNIYRAEPRCP